MPPDIGERNHIMRKVSLVLAIVLIVGCLLSSCGGRTYKAFKTDPNYVPSIDIDNSVTFQDFDGESVTITEEVKNIVCFSPLAAKIISGLGDAKYIKAVDEPTKEAVSVLNVITKDDIESKGRDAIPTEEANIIFIDSTYDVDTLLEGVETPIVVVPENTNLNEAVTLIRIIEKVLRSTRDSVADAIETRMSSASQASGEGGKFTAFIDLGMDGKNFKTTGGDTFLSEILNICGCENVFADQQGYFTVTADQLVEKNPTFIFTVSEKLNDYYRIKGLDVINTVDRLDPEDELVDRLVQVNKDYFQYPDLNLPEAISTVFGAVNDYRISQN